MDHRRWYVTILFTLFLVLCLPMQGMAQSNEWLKAKRFPETVITRVEFFFDGDRMALQMPHERAVSLYNLPEERSLKTYHAPDRWGFDFQSEPKDIAISPSEQQLAVGVDGAVGLPLVSPFLFAIGFYRVDLWNVQSGQIEETMSLNHLVSSVAYSPDGERLAVGGNPEGTIEIWNPQSGEMIHTLPNPIPQRTQQGFDNRASLLMYSTDGRLLISAWPDGGVRIWNPTTGSLISTYAPDWEAYRKEYDFFDAMGKLHSLNSTPHDVDVTPDGRYLVVVEAWKDRMRIYDLRSGEVVFEENPRGYYDKAEFSDDGQYLALTEYYHNRKYKLVIKETERWDETMELGQVKVRLNDLDFSPDGRWIAAGAGDLLDYEGHGLLIWKNPLEEGR